MNQVEKTKKQNNHTINGDESTELLPLLPLRPVVPSTPRI